MADVKIIGRVAVKVLPDVSGFREKAKRDIEKEASGLDQKATIEVEVDADTRPLEKEVKKAKKDVEKDTFQVKFGPDYDSLNKAISAVQKELDKLEMDSLEVDVNSDSLNELKNVLEELKDESQVVMTVDEGLAGAEQVLKKIQEIRREAAQTEFKFDVDPESLDQLEQEILDKYGEAISKVERDPKYGFRISNDRASMEKVMGEIEAKLKEVSSVYLEVDMDKQSLETARADLEKAIAETPLDITADFSDQDSLKAARRQLERLLSEQRAVSLEVMPDEESIRLAMERLDQFIDKEEEKDIDLPVGLTGLGLAAARLNYATRPRVVPFYVKVDEKSLLIAEGILKSLSGINTLQSIGTTLENVATSFDKFAIKGGFWSAAIAGIVNTLTSLTTSLFSVGEGVVNVLGLWTTMPALAASLGSIVAINVAAWENFGAAVDGDAEALAALPPLARDAAQALQGTWEAIQRPVQNSFWLEMGTSLQDAVLEALPRIRYGLNETSVFVGRFARDFLASFEEIARNGQMEEMFQNLQDGMENAVRGARPLADAINLLGLRGSEYLPRLGTFFSDSAESFLDWLQAADAAGDLNRWIEEGIQSMKDMVAIGGSVIDIFTGITEASLRAGGPTLSEFRETMADIGDIVNSEPFKTRLAIIFKGARDGATALNEGVKDLASSMMVSAGFTADLLDGLGHLGGGLLSNIARSFLQIKFQDGLLEGVEGLNDGLDDLGPAFDSFGRIVGGVAELAGDVFEGIAPVINNVADIVDKTLTRLQPALTDAIPVLTGFIDQIITGASGPFLTFVDVIATLAESFLNLPGPIRDAAVALGALILMRGQLSSLLGAVDRFWNQTRTVHRDGTYAVMSRNEQMRQSFGGMVGAIRGESRKMPDAVAPIKGASETVVTNVGNATTSLGRLERTLGSSGGRSNRLISGLSGSLRGLGAAGRIAAGGIGALMGGLPGLLLTGGFLALSAISGAAADAKAKVEGFADTLTAGGAMSSATRQFASDQLAMERSTLWWSESSFVDIARDLGIEMETLIDAATGGADAFDQIREAAEANRSEWAKTIDLLGQAGGVQGMLFKMFSSPEQDLISELSSMNGQLETARKRIRDAAEAMGVDPSAAPGIISSIKTLSDEAATADDRVRSLTDLVGDLNAKMNDAADADQAFGDALRGARDTIQRILEENPVNVNDFIRNDGTFVTDIVNDVNGIGSEIKTQFDQIAQTGLESIARAVEGVDDQAARLDIIRPKIEEIREQARTMLENLGFDPAKIDAALDNLILDPLELEAILRAESTEELQSAVKSVTDGVPKDIPMAIKADPFEAYRSVSNFKAQTEQQFANPFVAELAAWPDPALQAIAEAVGQADAYRRGDYEAILTALERVQPGISASLGSIKSMFTDPAHQAHLSAINGTLPGVTSAITMINDNLVAPAHVGRLFAANETQAGVSSATATIRTVTNSPWQAFINVLHDAATAAASIRGYVYGLNAEGLTVTVGVVADTSMVSASAIRGRLPKGGNLFYADGGFHGIPKLKNFADGGIENHQAQIVRTPTYRVWAEPETGGEAYIPYAMHKRSRSVNILRQVASDFGFDLRSYADGGAPSVADVTSGGAVVNIGQMINQSNSTPDDFARALMRKVRVRGGISPVEGI